MSENTTSSRDLKSGTAPLHGRSMSRGRDGAAKAKALGCEQEVLTNRYS
jgi:hypothetical protein